MMYTNSCLLFMNKDKKHPKAPDFYGTMKFDKAFLMQKFAEAKGSEVEIKLDMWSKKDRFDHPMFALQVNTYVSPAVPTAPPKHEPKYGDMPF